MTRGHDVIRLAIIGTGLAVEKLHWPALRRLTDRYRVAAFCNRSRAGAERFAGYSGISMDAFVANYQDLLGRDDVDAVLISLPIPMNYPVTHDALSAGKHVICEKPTGASAEDANAFVELSERFPDRSVMVAENWFYRDDLRLARSLLDDNVIGAVHVASWRTVSQLIPREGTFSSTSWRQQAEYVGGPHLDAGVHHIAQLRLLCGDAARMSGEIQDTNQIFAGPSDLTLNVRFVSGAIGNYTASYPELPAPDEPNDLRLYGTDGVMSVGRDGIRIVERGGRVDAWQVDMPDGGYYNEFLNFHEAVVSGAPLVGTIAQSVRNMEWITQGIASAGQGQVMAMAGGPIPLSEHAVPLWRPAGGSGLFDGLGTTVNRETTSSARPLD